MVVKSLRPEPGSCNKKLSIRCLDFQSVNSLHQNILVEDKDELNNHASLTMLLY